MLPKRKRNDKLRLDKGCWRLRYGFKKDFAAICDRVGRKAVLPQGWQGIGRAGWKPEIWVEWKCRF